MTSACLFFKVQRWEQRSTKHLKTSIPSWKASARHHRTCNSFFCHRLSPVCVYSVFLKIHSSTCVWPLKVDCCKGCFTGTWKVFFHLFFTIRIRIFIFFPYFSHYKSRYIFLHHKLFVFSPPLFHLCLLSWSRPWLYISL